MTLRENNIENKHSYTAKAKPIKKKFHIETHEPYFLQKDFVNSKAYNTENMKTKIEDLLKKKENNILAINFETDLNNFDAKNRKENDIDNGKKEPLFTREFFNKTNNKILKKNMTRDSSLAPIFKKNNSRKESNLSFFDGLDMQPGKINQTQKDWSPIIENVQNDCDFNNETHSDIKDDLSKHTGGSERLSFADSEVLYCKNIVDNFESDKIQVQKD